MALKQYESRIAAAVDNFSLKEEKKETKKEDTAKTAPKVKKRPEIAVSAVEKTNSPSEQKKPEKGRSGSAQDGLVVVPKKMRKDVRFGLLLTPEAKSNLEKVSAATGRSKNDLVNYMLEHVYELLKL